MQNTRVSHVCCPQDARELLYRMTADGIVAMQEIHKSNDMAPSRSFYTWHVTSGWWPLKNACMRSLLRAAANTLSLLQANRAKAGPVRRAFVHVTNIRYYDTPSCWGVSCTVVRGAKRTAWLCSGTGGPRLR